METEKQKFKERDLVWAKVRGHAWWPAIVGEINQFQASDREMKYIVHFIGDQTRSFLARKFIRNFRSTFFQLAFISKTKNLRRLQHAIK